MSSNDIYEGSHMEFADNESAGLNSTKWERWAKRVRYLTGLESLDGDNSADAKAAGTSDGYSLDEAFDAFEAGCTPEDHAARIKANIATLTGASA